MARTQSTGTERGLRWMGPWNSGTIYYANDAVTYLDKSYMCTASHTNFPPPNSQYWDTLAAAGKGISPVKLYFYASL